MSSKKKVDHAKHVISVYRNKDPSMVLSEVGGLVAFLGVFRRSFIAFLGVLQHGGP
jgi:hypothetical protein